MGYINDFEQELRVRLEKGWSDADVKWVKETILQSYRNGVEVGMQADKRDVRMVQKFSKGKKP